MTGEAVDVVDGDWLCSENGCEACRCSRDLAAGSGPEEKTTLTAGRRAFSPATVIPRGRTTSRLSGSGALDAVAAETKRCLGNTVDPDDSEPDWKRFEIPWAISNPVGLPGGPSVTMKVSRLLRFSP